MGGGGHYNANRFKSFYSEQEKAKIEKDKKEKEKDNPKQEENQNNETEKLATLYQSLRITTSEIEVLIENSTKLNAKDLHRLDKAVTVQKVGFKLIKKILSKYGYRELKRLAFQDAIKISQEKGF